MAQSRQRNPNTSDAWKSVLDRLDNLENNMSTFEGEVKHLATKADLEKLRADTNAAEKRMYAIVVAAAAIYFPALIGIINYFF